MFGESMDPKKQALQHLKKAMLSLSYGESPEQEESESAEHEASESPEMEAMEHGKSLNPMSSAAKQAEDEIMAPGGMKAHKENDGVDEELQNAKRDFMLGHSKPMKKVSSMVVAVKSPKHPYGKRKK